MKSQEQFLECLERDEAQRRFHAALALGPLGEERVSLDAALGRVLAREVTAEVDVPSFDRSNYDGFAVRAADTYGAREEVPRRLRMLDESIATGVAPTAVVTAGATVQIATGGMLPRGADAVVMVEHTDCEGDELLVRRAVTPGFGVTFAGTDIAAGEIVLRRGELLTSRETGVLAAVGIAEIAVWRKPRVAILSTGDEIIAPGAAMRPGLVYDSNAQILADAVCELGGEPLRLGIAPDEQDQLERRLAEALERADVVLLSGGTSKGAGDVSYRAVARLRDPGIVAHGVALKPGKPICLAVTRGKAVVVLPGFPTSAIFTFHEFVAPVVRLLGGRAPQAESRVDARLAVKVNSEIGRTEYLLVGLFDADGQLAAYPMGKGSGSVTTFSRADGFVTIDRHREIIEAGSTVSVQLLASHLRVPDLVVIGSHCVGLDYLLGLLEDEGFHSKFLAVGSTAGLHAAQRGECDVAGMHLMDPATGEYNRPFLTPDLALIAGYGRLQGIVFRLGDERFAGRQAADAIEHVKRDVDCFMVNRNQGSGTRILIDKLLANVQPAGYAVQARSHNAVAAAVAQGRADWGVAIQWVAKRNGLGFLPLAHEQYDFVAPRSRLDRPAVAALRRLLTDPVVHEHLTAMGFRVGRATP
jgi:molybdopterin molybdotransferase/putative molybdopterin biosynthesis protein